MVPVKILMTHKSNQIMVLSLQCIENITHNGTIAHVYTLCFSQSDLTLSFRATFKKENNITNCLRENTKELQKVSLI